DGLRGDLHVTFEEGTWAAWLYDLPLKNLPGCGYEGRLDLSPIYVQSAPLRFESFGDAAGLVERLSVRHSLSRWPRRTLYTPGYRPVDRNVDRIKLIL
ncbi:MAG: hypothetical protein WCA19_05795, partial [Candidatus Acidiferrales bacterium]